MTLFDAEPIEWPEPLVPEPPIEPAPDGTDELTDARLDGLLPDEPDEICPCGSRYDDGRHRVAMADRLMRRLHPQPEQEQPADDRDDDQPT